MDFTNNDLAIFDSIVRGGSENKNYVTYYIGTITSVQADQKKATVRITGSDGTIELLNKATESLSVGNSVFILSFDGGSTISNGIIAYKFG